MADDETKRPAQHIKPPKPLSRKVRPFGGPTPDEAIARADRSVVRVRAEFVASMEDDVVELDRLYGAYRKTPTPEQLTQIFRIAHNLRGLGATFHYELMTRLGTSMCRYITELPPGKTLEPVLLQVHIQAMKAVVRSHMEGKGDKISQDVATTLDLIVRKATGQL